MKITKTEVEITHQRWMLIGGIAFALLSAFFVYMAFVDRTSEADLGTLLFIVGTAVAAVFGICFRPGITIDIPSRTYRRRFGVLVPIWLSRHSLSDFDRVRVFRDPNSGEGLRQFVTPYHIELAGPGGRLDIEKHAESEKARDAARRLAEALDLGLTDAVGRMEIDYEAGHLGDSVRQRRQRVGALDLGVPEPPPDMKTQVTVERTEMILHMPPDGFTAKAFRNLAGLVAFSLLPILLVVMSWLLDEEGKEPARSVRTVIMLLSYGFAALFPLVIAGWAICKRVLTRWQVHISPEGLRIVRQGPIREKVFEMAADELIELNVMKREGKDQGMTSDLEDIVLRDHSQTVRFGGSLPVPEKEWIVAVIEHVISA